eukprot:jgi/Chlat1/1685/Chrsp127S01956
MPMLLIHAGVLVLLLCSITRVTAAAVAAAVPAAGADQELFAWGRNAEGQLGVSDRVDRFLPVPASALRGHRARAVALGAAHAVAVLDNGGSNNNAGGGRAWSAGADDAGQLGNEGRSGDGGAACAGPGEHRNAVNATQAAYHSRNVQSVCAGANHSLVWTQEGELFAWGANYNGQLGVGDKKAHYEIMRVADADPVRQAACGGQHSLALTTNGKLVPRFTPAAVRRLGAGQSFSLAFCEDGALWAFGDNSEGRLGTEGPDTRTSATPMQVAMGGVAVKDFACGRQHVVALGADGKIYAWGANNVGQLGVGDTLPRMKPTRIRSFDSSHVHNTLHTLHLSSWYTYINLTSPQVDFVSAGEDSSLAVMSTGALYSWGGAAAASIAVTGVEASSNNRGGRSKPTLALPPQDRSPILAIAAGGYAHAYGGHSLAITAEGSLYAWQTTSSSATTQGWNAHGQLGVAPVEDSDGIRATPKKLRLNGVRTIAYACSFNRSKQKCCTAHRAYLFLSQAKLGRVAAGQSATAILTETGEVYTFGANEFGVLGRGDFRPQDLGKGPKDVQVDGYQVIEMCVGYGHMLALTSEGRLTTNWDGRCTLGDATFMGNSDTVTTASESKLNPATTTPKRMHLMSSQQHNLLRDRAAPALVAYLTEERIATIAAGQYHSIAITRDGRAFTWGYNRDYELGLGQTHSLQSTCCMHVTAECQPTNLRMRTGDNMDRVLPQAVPGLEGKKLVAAAAGGYHSLVVTDDGSMFGFGLNNYGQVGGPYEKSFVKTPSSVPVATDSQHGRLASRHYKCPLAHGTRSLSAKMESYSLGVAVTPASSG